MFLPKCPLTTVRSRLTSQSLLCRMLWSA